MKKIVGILFGLALCLMTMGGVAKADPSCTSQICLPGFPGNCSCVGWTMPAGALACNGSTPAADEAILYSGTNYTGACMRLPMNFYSADMNPSGWGPGSIRSMKVGTSAHVYACNGPNVGSGCSTMGSPWGQYFPNTSGSMNWRSAMVY